MNTIRTIKRITEEEREELFETLFKLRNPKEYIIIKTLIENNRDWFCASLSKKAKFTVAYTYKLLKEYHELGIVESEKKGRKRFVKLLREQGIR
jgi:predicted transcriptional regulator|tara:strand:- start:5629 stop:5910 length:282 start_codon:yes stop_codon:yes gene_type:complete